jgi:hypothetical protein
VIPTLFALWRHRRGALAVLLGFVLGAGLVRLDAELHLIPAAERVARAEERARIATEAATTIAKSAGRARQIERTIGNATDLELRCTLNPRACGVH